VCVCVADNSITVDGKRLFTLLLHICMQVEMCVIYLRKCVCVYVWTSLGAGNCLLPTIALEAVRLFNQPTTELST